MSANVETMMYVREKPWHGLGTKVDEAPTSAEALELAGLNWNVEQTPVYTADGTLIPNYKALMILYLVLSLTDIRLCRMRRHLNSLIPLWVKPKMEL